MKKKVMSYFTILVITALVGINVNLTIQNRSIPVILNEIEALSDPEIGDPFANWKYAIKNTTVECTLKIPNHETGEIITITYNATKTECPKGGIACTPVNPC
jgi:hypothetical protein